MEDLLKLLKAITTFAIISFVILLTWNWLCPVLFGLPVINYWQAIGLRLLTESLFGDSKE